MRESVLTLDPLDFGVAGGHLVGVIRLDGQQSPIEAHAKMEVRTLLLAKLLPTIALGENSVGQINGEIELIGQGDSIAQMVSTADGRRLQASDQERTSALAQHGTARKRCDAESVKCPTLM
jgi:AsmA protein